MGTEFGIDVPIIPDTSGAAKVGGILTQIETKADRMRDAFKRNNDAINQFARQLDAARARVIALETASLSMAQRIANSVEANERLMADMRSSMAQPLEKMTTWDSFNASMEEGEAHFDRIVADMQQLGGETQRTAAATGHLGTALNKTGQQGEISMERIIKGMTTLNARTVATAGVFMTMGSIASQAMGMVTEKVKEGYNELWKLAKPGGLLDRLQKGHEITWNESTDPNVIKKREIDTRISDATRGPSTGSLIWSALKGQGDSATMQVAADSTKLAGLRMQSEHLRKEIEKTQLVARKPLFEAALADAERLDGVAAAQLRIKLAQIQVIETTQLMKEARAAGAIGWEAEAAAIAEVNAELEHLRKNQGLIVEATPITGGMTAEAGRRYLQDLRAVTDKKFARSLEEGRAGQTAIDAARAAGEDTGAAYELSQKAVRAQRAAAARSSSRDRELPRMWLQNFMPDKTDIEYYGQQVSRWLDETMSEIERDVLLRRAQFDVDIANKGPAGLYAGMGDAIRQVQGSIDPDAIIRQIEENQRKARELEERTTAGGGVTRGLRDINDHIQSTGALISDSLVGGMEEFEDSIVRAARTGKLEFGALFDYILDQLIRIGLRGGLQALVGDSIESYLKEKGAT